VFASIDLVLLSFGSFGQVWISNKVHGVKQNRAGAEFELSWHPKI
jgi:hypothetical protein